MTERRSYVEWSSSITPAERRFVYVFLNDNPRESATPGCVGRLHIATRADADHAYGPPLVVGELMTYEMAAEIARLGGCSHTEP